MKLSRKILSVLLSLLLITSIILWVLAKNINPETIKQLVSNQITTLTHKKSHIDGAISWQLFPRPGLKFSKIVIGEEPLKQDYFLTIDNLILNLKITPLLRGKFVFSEVNIDGLKTQVNLDVSKETKSPGDSSHQNSNSPKSDQFAIEKLLVSHGQLTINKNGHTTVFKNLQLGVEQFNLNSTPFTVQIKARLNEYESNPLVKANINFKGRLSLTPILFHQLSSGINQSSIDGQLLLQNVLLNKFAIKKISATIKTNKTDIQFNPFTLSLYNGESIGNMDYAFATQQFSLNQTATNLNGKQLMAVLLGHELISGNLDYSIHATIPLKNPAIDTIAGKGAITIKDGEIYQLNLDNLLNNLKEKLNNLMNNPKAFDKSIFLNDWDSSKYTQGNTPFKLASIQYQFQKGTLTSDSILLQTDKLQAKGKGALYLSNMDMNSTLQVILNSNNTDLNLQKIQAILGGSFPLVVSGTIEHPEVRPDFKIIGQYWGQLLIKTKLEKPIQEIKNRLKEIMN